MKYAHLLLRNLLRNKRRTIMTALSIALSLFIFSGLATIPSMINRFLSDSATSLRVITHNKAGIFYLLPVAYQRRILATPHVQAASAFLFFGGIYQDPHRQFPNFAVDPDQAPRVWPDWGISDHNAGEFQRIRTACLVAPGLLREFGWKVGQQIILRGTIYPTDLTLQIVGLLNERAPPDAFMFRRDYLDEAIGRTGMVNAFWVIVDHSSSIPSVIAAIDEEFANSEGETQTESQSQFVGGFLAGLRPFVLLLEFIGLIAVVSMALVAINTAAMSMRERQSEIAVMRAIGFGPLQIFELFIGECSVVAIIGGIIGCGAARLVLSAVPLIAILGPSAIVRMPPRVLVMSLVLTMALGVLSGLIPTWTPVRREIVDALRHVG